MSRYALFSGCTIQCVLPHLEVAARKAFPLLGVELVDLPDLACCPDPIGVQSMDGTLWLSMAARNLSLAEKAELDIVSLCNGCFETLKTAEVVLKGNKEKRDEVNKILSQIGLEYKGTIQVKHHIEVLHQEIGLAAIAEKVVRPLEGLNVAVHYGCHLVRPSRFLQYDDPEDPRSIDELVRAIGATSVPYTRRMLCCGGGAKAGSKDAAMAIARDKFLNVQRSEADCMAVVCPNCMTQYDANQRLIERTFGEQYGIPVVYYMEMLSLALGVPVEELGFKLHRAPMNRFLAKLNNTSVGAVSRSEAR